MYLYFNIGLFALLLSFVSCGRSDSETYKRNNREQQQSTNFLSSSILQEEEMNWLNADWRVSDSEFKLSINSNSETFTYQVSYDVGSDSDKEIPDQTVCTYRYEGTVRVVRATDSMIQYYLTHDKTVPQYSIEYKPESIFLVEAIENEDGCLTFIERQREKIKNDNNWYYNIAIKKIDDNKFLDVWEDKFYEVD